jgi:hypothetical protein
LTHVDGKSGLVTDGRGNTTEKSGHLGTGLGEAENVVDEEKHYKLSARDFDRISEIAHTVLAFGITEVLSHSQTGH